MTRPPPVVAQYLSRYASPEARLADALAERYRAVLVVPAHRELPGFTSGYQPAIDGAGGRVLLIVVVNAAEPLAASTWPAHRELLAALRQEGPAQALPDEQAAWLVRATAHDLLLLDRASPERSFPAKQGVGLARRIGCDIALALWARGRVELPYLYCTDADTRLSSNHFEPQPEQPAAGIVHAFWHEPGGDPRIDRATAVYELGLRYHVAGLAHARSPYAFHSIGSAMAPHAVAYAAVRGFPKRLAGEDFYLLDKLAKVGAIWRADDARVSIASRASSRTVHGTGVAAARIAAELDAGSTAFYHPHNFELLRLWLGELEELAEHRDLARTRAAIAHSAGADRAALEGVLDELGAWPALRRALAETPGAPQLRARLHTWFDGFRTLKLIHGLRRRGFASVELRRALAADWSPVAREAADGCIDELRRQLEAHLARSPPRCGVAHRSALARRP